MTAPLPLCVIGAGSIGIRHVEVARLSERTRLTAIVEPSETRRGQLVQMGLPAVATIDDVPAATAAAVIATPTADHMASALAALGRNWSVILEKPVAATLDEARTVVAAADKASLALVVGHHRRCHPFSIEARRAAQAIGALVGVQGLWSLRKNDAYFDVAWRRQPGAGPLMTNLSHEIDLLRFIVGDIAEVSALTSSARRGFAIEDTAALAFRFANGALGSFLISDAGASPWSFEAASFENPSIAGCGQDCIRIIGTEGALEFPSLTRWGPSGPGEIEWSRPLRRHEAIRFDPVDPLWEQVDRFARVVSGGTDDVLCVGADGVAALGVTLATALSGKLGRPVSADDVPGDFRGI